MTLLLVPKTSEVEHKPICSVCSEPWPCTHIKEEGRFRTHQHYSVMCLACGKPRNGWTSLSIERGFDGRAVYFHARKKCAMKAALWWDEHVKPLVGEEAVCRTYEFMPGFFGQTIQDLTRYVALRSKPKAVEN